MSTFMHFLRLALPGYFAEITVEVARDILPLVREYQTEELKEDIDVFLSKITEDSCPSTDLVANIIEAEEYCLDRYLTACTDVASKRKHKLFVLEQNFDRISENTRLKIAHKRLQIIGEIYDEHIFYTPLCNQWFYENEADEVNVPFGDWRYEYMSESKDQTMSSRCKEIIYKTKNHFDFCMK